MGEYEADNGLCHHLVVRYIISYWLQSVDVVRLCMSYSMLVASLLSPNHHMVDTSEIFNAVNALRTNDKNTQFN